MQVKHSLESSVNNYAYFSEKQIFQGIYINYWYFIGYVGLITLMLGIEMLSHLLESYTLITFSLILNIFFMAEVLYTLYHRCSVLSIFYKLEYAIILKYVIYWEYSLDVYQLWPSLSFMNIG